MSNIGTPPAVPEDVVNMAGELANSFKECNRIRCFPPIRYRNNARAISENFLELLVMQGQLLYFLLLSSREADLEPFVVPLPWLP